MSIQFNQPQSQPQGQAGFDTNAFSNAAAQYAAQQSQPAQQYTQPGVGPSPSQNPGAAAGFQNPQYQPAANQPPQQQVPNYGPAPTGPTPQPQGFQEPPQAGSPWAEVWGGAQQQPAQPQWRPLETEPQHQPQYQFPQQPQPQQPTQAQQQYPAFDAATAARLQQYGVDPNLPPHEQVNRLTQRIAELTPYAQFGQQMASQPVGNQQPAQPAANAEDEFNVDDYFDKAWGAPQWNQQYDVAIQQGLVERDPGTGMFRPSQGFEMMVSPQLLHGLNEAMQFQTQNVQKIFRDNPFRQFYQVLREPIKREIEREARSLVQSELQQVKTKDFLDKFQEENKDWMFTTDATGRRVYSPIGEQFYREAEALVDQGLDAVRAVQYAAKITQSGRQQQPPGQQQPAQYQQPYQQPAPQAQQGQQMLPFMQQPQPQMQPQQQPYQMAPQAGYQNSPTFPRPMSPEMASAIQQQSFLQNALQRSSYTPSAVGAPGAAQPPGPPQMLSQDGLESMFTNAASQVGVA